MYIYIYTHISIYTYKYVCLPRVLQPPPQAHRELLEAGLVQIIYIYIYTYIIIIISITISSIIVIVMFINDSAQNSNINK